MRRSVARPGRAWRATARLVCVLVGFGLIGCGTHGANAALISTSTAAGTAGDVCGPTDRVGVASFGIESVQNASAHDVTVTGVTVESTRVKVVDWFLAQPPWAGGVRAGRFRDRDKAALPPTITGQQKRIVAISLRATAPPNGEEVPVIVAYETSRGSGSLRLAFRVGLVGHGKSC